MAKLRIGVIGVGWFGEIHCMALAGIPVVEIVALCDKDEARLADVAGRFGVSKTYSDYPDLLADPSINAVHIVTRWDTHADITCAALAAGKHVFLEKPMAPSLAECARICEAGQKAEAILMIGHVCRFNPRITTAKREIEAGAIGKVVAINARRNVPAAWAVGALDKVNPISDTGIHDTDVMLWLTGSRVESVYCQTVAIKGYKYPEILHLMYRFENGASAIYESAWAMPESAPFVIDERMSLIGEQGFVQIQDTFPNLGVCGPDGFTSPDTTYWPEMGGMIGGALRDENMYFARCAMAGTKPTIITPEESMEAMRTVLAAQESAETGKPVKLG